MSARRPAFSLIELVLVVAIGAALAAVALPKMNNATARYRADYAAKQVASDLERARANARLTGTARTVAFDLTANRYTVTGTAAGSTVGVVVSLAAAPYLARVTAADFGGSTTATFTAYGDPLAGGTVTLTSGRLTRTVTLDAGSGRARWQ